jgi:hypothetical protein
MIGYGSAATKSAAETGLRNVESRLLPRVPEGCFGAALIPRRQTEHRIAIIAVLHRVGRPTQVRSRLPHTHRRSGVSLFGFALRDYYRVMFFSFTCRFSDHQIYSNGKAR